jgi:S1-C subfamily serine protease
VVDVKSGGPADKAGLRSGDIITGLGDRAITTITSLAEALAGDRPGQTTTITYSRNGNRKTTDITLGEQ